MFSCQKLRTIGEKKSHFDERVLWGGSTTQNFYLLLMGREVILLQVLSSFLSWNKKQLYDSIHYHGGRFSPLYQSPARDQIGLEYWMWFTVQAKVLYKMIACCMILHWTWKIMIKQFRTSKQQWISKYPYFITQEKLNIEKSCFFKPLWIILMPRESNDTFYQKLPQCGAGSRETVSLVFCCLTSNLNAWTTNAMECWFVF